MTEKNTYNFTDIDAELKWFSKILEVRFKINRKEKCEYTDVYQIDPPLPGRSKSDFASFINQKNFNFEERFLLILAIVPHIKPELLDIFLTKDKNYQQIFAEFGGRKSKNQHGFIPTGETAMFILASNNLQRRFSVSRAFEATHPFSAEKILWLEDVEKGEPVLSGALIVSKEILELVTTGKYRKPVFRSEFPGTLLSTKKEWDDLVLPDQVLNQLGELELWILNRGILKHKPGMDKYLKPGFKALFYGQPGTGKTFASILLGKRTGRDVYRIDLMQAVSKYIGETEKNLATLFDRAENQGWILFFDEADALFGSRTSVRDAHDKYANQEVSYLIQRIENYRGLVILESNFKNNIDDAFIRRMHLLIHFPMPGVEERFKLWKQGFGKSVRLHNDIDLKRIALEYEISGSTLSNIIQNLMLNILERKDNQVKLKDIIDGIKSEREKIPKM